MYKFNISIWQQLKKWYNETQESLKREASKISQNQCKSQKLLIKLICHYHKMILWNFEVILPKIVEAMARPRIFSLHGIAASNQKKNWNGNHQTIIFFIADQNKIIFFWLKLFWPLIWQQRPRSFLRSGFLMDRG